MKKYIEADDIQLVFSGHNYFELLEEIIDNSKHTLHLQTYIFDIDETGLKVIEALKRAASRKVSVFLMIDSFGSGSFSKETRQYLKKSGVNFRKFSPTFSPESIHLGRRLHYKIVIADQYVGMIGGINIANKYNETGNVDPWLDYAIQVKGSVCAYLHLLCEKEFKNQTAKALNVWENNTRTENKNNSHLIRFRSNDFLKRKNEIHNSYVEGIKNAQKSITIVASYFLPGKGLRKLLADASSRGVEIRIVLAGKSDVASVRLAEIYFYDFLVRNKIQLYEWTNSVLHGKAMVVDNKWTTIGSYNLNFLSHYISMELNADIISETFVKKFTGHLEEIIKTTCRAIDLNKPEHSKNIFSKFIRWLAYSFFRFLMILSVNKQRRKKKKKK